jgi:uncharacterized protein YraI
MYSFRLAAFALLSALIVVAFTLPLEAGEARASGNVTVHSGPGQRYEIIGNLRDGRYYEVEECTRQSRWCLVSHRGELLGWVLGSYLVGSPAKVEATPPDFEFMHHPRFGNLFGD